MIIKNINIVFVSIIAVIIFSSCTAPITINTRNSEPVIVIYGQITDEYKYQYIRITSSSPYFDEKMNQVISGALVQVESTDGDLFRFYEGTDGYYFSESRFAATVGTTYNLTVEVDFDKDGKIEIYEASTTILPVIPVDSVDIKPINIMGYRHFSMNFYMQDPSEAENFYLCIFYINDSLTNNKLSQYLYSDDRMFNGEYVDGASFTYFEDATDEKNLTSPRADDEDNYMVSPGDIIRLQLLNIEKGYYNFISESISVKYGENPFFGGPPSNISTNISNGAVGYFTGFSLQEQTTVVP